MADSIKSVPQPTAPTYTAPPAPRSEITLCLSYFRTGPGIIKLVQLAIGIFCMSCAAPAWTRGTHWFLFVVVTAFVATTLWCFIYLLNLKHAITMPIDWLLTELIITMIYALLYIIAAIVQLHATVSEIRPPTRLKPFYITAGVFGIFNFFAYCAGSFFLFRDWQDNHPNSSFSGSVIKRSNPA